MTDHPPEIVAAVRAAEAAAQRSVCNVPNGPLPRALQDALDLRVKVNLEQTSGQPLVRVGSSDPAVRRLEEPYSKRTVPGDAPKNGGRPRRTANKATRKRIQKETS